MFARIKLEVVRVTKVLAILMIYLLISLTFFTAFAFATIYKVEISGQDKVPGSIKSTDTVVVRTESTMPCSVIGDSFNLSAYTAMTCSGSAPMVCTYSKSLRDQYSSVSATVREQGSGLIQQASAYPDLLAPAFTAPMNVRSLGNSVSVTYTLRDYANEYYMGNCSGISKVDFLINKQVVSTKEYPVGTCQITDTITGTKANFIGEVNTSINIEDYMDHKANLSGGTVFIDTVAPTIQTAVKAYRPGTDEEIKTAVTNSTVTRTVEIRITAEDDAIRPNGGAVADFSTFDRTGSVDQSSVEAVCDRNGWDEVYTCSFLVSLNPSSLTLKFPVNVTDTLGNTAGKTLSITFTAHPGATVGTTGKTYIPGTEDEVGKIAINASRSRTVDALVTVKDEALLTAVTGNFQELSRTVGSSQRSVPGECSGALDENDEAVAGEYNCWFRGLTLNPNKTSPKGNITITDDIGKQVSKSVSFSFVNVPSAGTVTKLGPIEQNQCPNSVCYLKAGSNTIRAQLSSSSTFFDGEVTINGARAYCEQNSTNTWYCFADITLATTNTALTLEGTDDFGNIMSHSTSIVVDGSPPVRVGEINVTPTCPTAGESLKIVMNITEDKGPTMTISANTEAISTKNVSQATCTRVGQTTQWRCLLSISEILEQEITEARLNVVVKDLAGNQLVEEVPVSVCINVDEVPNLIEQIKVVGRLPRVDRKTAEAIKLKLPIGLEIVPSGDMEILARYDIACPGTPCVDGKPYMVNDAELTPTLILPIRWTENCQETLDEIESSDTIPVTCSQEFKIRSGNRIYSQREQENFTFSLEMYNQVGLNSTYKTKIKEIKNEITQLDHSIEKKQKTYKTLGKLCALAETMGRINALLMSLKSVLWGVCIALNAFFGIGEMIWKPINIALSTEQGIVDSIIWPQGWVPTGTNWFGLFVVKLGCSIYTCKFYDFNTFVDIGFSVASHFATVGDQKIFEQEAARIARQDAETAASKGISALANGLDPTKAGKQVNFYGNTETWQVGDTFYAKDAAAPLGYQVYQYNPNTKNFVYFDRSASTPNTQYTNYVPPAEYSRNNPANIPLAPHTAAAPSPTANVAPNARPTQTQPGGGILSTGIQVPNLGKPLKSLWTTVSKWGDKTYKAGIVGNGVTVNNAVDAFLGDSSTWLVNPYKSKYYDSMCAPAALFNDRKQRQILCKRLGCLDTMASTGGPLEVCEYEYSLDMCMYVESARYKLVGKESFFKTFGQQFFNNIIGIGTTAAYLFLTPPGPPLGCVHYQVGLGAIEAAASVSVVDPRSAKSVICGITGSLLSLREIASFWDSKYLPSTTKGPPNLPSTSYDYCQGGRIYQ